MFDKNSLHPIDLFAADVFVSRRHALQDEGETVEISGGLSIEIGDE